MIDYGFMSIQYNEIETLFLNAIFVDVKKKKKQKQIIYMHM